jgi:hypothetical protein
MEMDPDPPDAAVGCCHRPFGPQLGAAMLERVAKSMAEPSTSHALSVWNLLGR